MNTTSNAGASSKSESETKRPSASGSENSGAVVPKGNITLAVATIVRFSLC
jgi:hypothetical protein